MTTTSPPLEPFRQRSINPLLSCMLAPGERPGLFINEGRGATLTLDGGRQVIDCGSISAALLGHQHPDLVAAVQQASWAPYVSDGIGCREREQAAYDLLEIAFRDEPWATAVRFCNSASEANDLAMSLARTITQRMPLVARQVGYHGGVGLAREVSDSPLWDGGLAARAGGITTPPDLGRDVRLLPGAPTAAPGVEDAPRVDELLDGAATLLDGAAAMIVDQGANGLVFVDGEYQDRLATLAREAGALWIADEAVTGLGRLGRSFGFQMGSSRPDIVTLGKGITAGAAPGGAVVVSRRVAELLAGQRWMTYSTFRGHPVTAAAISATVRCVDREGLIARAAELGAWLKEELLKLVARHPCAITVRGEGLHLSMELRGSSDHEFQRWHGDGAAPPVAELVSQETLKHGALVAAYSGLTLWFVPPLIISRQQLEHVLDATDKGLALGDSLI
jgi:4-aminobutyrate aminotransferase-like enzyme